MSPFSEDWYQNVPILQNVPSTCISTFWEIGTFCKIRPKKYRSYKMYRFLFSRRNRINSYSTKNRSFILYFRCVKVHFQRSVHFERSVLKCTNLAKSTFGYGPYWIEFFAWKCYIVILLRIFCMSTSIITKYNLFPKVLIVHTFCWALWFQFVQNTLQIPRFTSFRLIYWLMGLGQWHLIQNHGWTSILIKKYVPVMLHSHVTKVITFVFAKIIATTYFHLTPYMGKSDYELE